EQILHQPAAAPRHHTLAFNSRVEPIPDAHVSAQRVDAVMAAGSRQLTVDIDTCMHLLSARVPLGRTGQKILHIFDTEGPVDPREPGAQVIAVALHRAEDLFGIVFLQRPHLDLIPDMPAEHKLTLSLRMRAPETCRTASP